MCAGRPRAIQRLPDILTLLRVASVPFLILLAYRGAHMGFTVLLAAAFLSDWADGFIARRVSGGGTAAGARLDSIADLLVYVSLPLCIWRLDPEFVLCHSGYIAAGVASFAVPVLVGYARYHRIPAHHTWSAKIAVCTLAGALFVFLLTGYALPFKLAVVLMLVAGCENVVLVLVLPEWTTDVPSLVHGWRRRKKMHVP